AMKAEASERIVELALGGFAFGIITAGRVFALLPALDETLEIVAAPAEIFQQAIVDFVFVELVGKFVEHEVGLLAGVIEVGGVAFGSGPVVRRGDGFARNAATISGRATPWFIFRAFVLVVLIVVDVLIGARRALLIFVWFGFFWLIWLGLLAGVFV